MGKIYPTGLNISASEIQHNMDMFAATAKLMMAATYPASFDWRKTSDGDYTTPIRDQGQCGSCVAFATVALMESVLEIAKKNPKLQPDLSEAYIFPRGGGNCAGGAQFERMLMAAESGTCDELCCPYTGDWKPCADYKNRLTAISSYKALYSADLAKSYIATTGPIMAGMEVYTDFFDYDGGIYSQEYGDFAGNHAILVVGYDDKEGIWICKNSWGTSWGESGWFRIKQGQCGMGSSFAFYSASIGSAPGPVPPVPPTPPVPVTPDLTVPIDGTLYVTMTKKPATEDAVLVVNNTQIGPMTLNKVVTAGAFKKGNTVQFDLLGIAHKNACFPTGWRIWTLRMGDSKYEFRVQEK